MAMLLSLFSESEMSGVSVAPVSSVNPVSSLRSDACSPQPLRAVGCCKGCPLFGLCDSGECGLQFPVDGESYGFTRFPNLGAFIEFKRLHGWL